jgi:hypothetical protein
LFKAEFKRVTMPQYAQKRLLPTASPAFCKCEVRFPGKSRVPAASSAPSSSSPATPGFPPIILSVDQNIRNGTILDFTALQASNTAPHLHSASDTEKTSNFEM